MYCEEFGKRALENIGDIMLSMALTNVKMLGYAPALSAQIPNNSYAQCKKLLGKKKLRRKRLERPT